jgi:DNA helicase-2/ATP-dependent DNA helicase PcrA
MSVSEISDSDIDRLLSHLNNGESDQDRYLSLDEARRCAILTYSDVQACPGSGKTTLVGLKLLLLLEKWNDVYSGLCVLTHSNVAINEIVSRLGSLIAGRKMLSYPHFIGTIQDFTNTFLALPYARSRGWDVHLVDESEYSSFVVSAHCWNFRVHDRATAKSYLFSYYFKQRKIDPSLFYFEHRDGHLKVSSAFMARVNELIDLEKDNLDEAYFSKKRRDLCAGGMFLYSEMYELGKQAITSNADLPEALRARFKITILDEMQDTQRHQDDLLNLVFPSSQCLIQRFGDPDQSIFDSMGGGLPNTSYNDATLHCIKESHRFVPSIAATVAALSYRQVGPFTGSKPQLTDGPRNTIYMFEDASISRVLPTFGQLVLTLPPLHRSVVKAVGAIGRIARSTGLTLPSYWAQFDSKIQNASFRAKSLCHAVRFCAGAGEGDVAGRYQVLVGAILEWMRRAGRHYVTRSGKSVSFNRAMLGSYLKDGNKVLAFGAMMNALIEGRFPAEEVWERTLEELCALLENGESSVQAAEYVAYDSSLGETSSGEEATQNRNVYDGVAGVKIALATIHSVKGETHDATLVCETSHYRWYDIQEMAEFLCKPDAARPIMDLNRPTSKESIRVTFMKRLFVAMSRPRYLLCLAVHKSHLTGDQIKYLKNVAGWHVEDLSLDN